MAIEDGQGTQGPVQGQPAQARDGLGPAGAARRRFAGGGAAGVLLTLASQPGMAANICTSPSGSLSGGLQSHQVKAQRCEGRSPGYWKNWPWPAGVAQNALFSKVYPCVGRNRDTYGKTTCFAILSHQAFDEANLGMHLMASYLNAIDGRTSFLTVPMLQKMWGDWQASGYYSPAPNVRWNAADIVIYLSGTMG